MGRYLWEGVSTGVYKYPKIAIENYESRPPSSSEKEATKFEKVEEMRAEGFLEGPATAPIALCHSNFDVVPKSGGRWRGIYDGTNKKGLNGWGINAYTLDEAGGIVYPYILAVADAALFYSGGVDSSDRFAGFLWAF